MHSEKWRFYNPIYSHLDLLVLVTKEEKILIFLCQFSSNKSDNFNDNLETFMHSEKWRFYNPIYSHLDLLVLVTKEEEIFIFLCQFSSNKSDNFDDNLETFMHSEKWFFCKPICFHLDLLVLVTKEEEISKISYINFSLNGDVNWSAFYSRSGNFDDNLDTFIRSERNDFDLTGGNFSVYRRVCVSILIWSPYLESYGNVFHHRGYLVDNASSCPACFIIVAVRN